MTHLPNRSLDQIFKALKGIFYYYLQQGFCVTFITGDGEFASLEQFTNLLMGAPWLNLTSAYEHEPFIEHHICVVNKIPFFLTLSRVLYFTTVTHLPDRSLDQIFKALKGIFYYYLQQGFHVTFIMGDGEFISLEQFTNLLMGAPWLNLTSANEHKPFIEHHICVVKERVWSIRQSLPFQTIPKIIMMHMVFYAVKLLNYFLAKGGVSEIYGPKTIMSGKIIDFKKFSLPFGAYCQVHEEKLP